MRAQHRAPGPAFQLPAPAAIAPVAALLALVALAATLTWPPAPPIEDAVELPAVSPPVAVDHDADLGIGLGRDWTTGVEHAAGRSGPEAGTPAASPTGRASVMNSGGGATAAQTSTVAERATWAVLTAGWTTLGALTLQPGSDEARASVRAWLGAAPGREVSLRVRMHCRPSGLRQATVHPLGAEETLTVHLAVRPAPGDEACELTVSIGLAAPSPLAPGDVVLTTGNLAAAAPRPRAPSCPDTPCP